MKIQEYICRKFTTGIGLKQVEKTLNKYGFKLVTFGRIGSQYTFVVSKDNQIQHINVIY